MDNTMNVSKLRATMQGYDNGGNQTMEKERSLQQPVTLRVEEPEEFDGLIKSKIITSIELAKKINSLFRPTFSDFEGCTLMPDQSGMFQVSLYFKDKGNPGPAQIKNISSIMVNTNGKSDVMARITNMNRINSSKKYDLTEQTKQALTEFMFNGVINYNKNSVNWGQCVTEASENAYNGYSIFVRVANLDIMKIIKKIYGNKINGSNVEYQMSIIRPTNGQINTPNANFLINISQLNTKQVEKLCYEIGMVPVQGNLPIIRD